MTLYMTLRSSIGLNPCSSSECFVFGIRVRNLEFKARFIILVHLDSSTNFIKSSPRKGHVAWKNLTVNLSSPGALFLAIFLITSSTFDLDISLNRAMFSSLVTRLGMCYVILLILSSLLIFGFVNSPLNYCTNRFSCLCCIIALWKNPMFLSPSSNHWILDFCFHRISSCGILSSNFLISGPSYSTNPPLLPSLIICCCTLFIFAWIISCSFCMLLNYSLFHFFILPFISFSLS